MTWNMLGTIFAGALPPGYARRGQRHNPPIRHAGLNQRVTHGNTLIMRGSLDDDEHQGPAILA